MVGVPDTGQIMRCSLLVMAISAVQIFCEPEGKLLGLVLKKGNSHAMLVRLFNFRPLDHCVFAENTAPYRERQSSDHSSPFDKGVDRFF